MNAAQVQHQRVEINYMLMSI